jgi:hypothetical protein
MAQQRCPLVEIEHTPMILGERGQGGSRFNSGTPLRGHDNAKMQVKASPFGIGLLQSGATMG